MKLFKLLIAIISVSLLVNGCAKDTDHILNLEFKPIDMKSEITIISEQAIGEISSELLADDALAFLYKPKTNQEEFNGGIKIKDRYYDVGQISVYQIGNEIEVKDLFGKKVIKFNGSLGVNYRQAIYILIEDLKPSVLLQVDGHVLEKDIDMDNEQEVVSTWGTLANTKIYKNIGNIIMVSDVNESVNAQVVVYRNDSNVFEIYQRPNEPRYYTLSNQILTEVQKP
ncbi:MULTISPECIES: hypothetical protein [Desulfitobacterium]|uniref:Lipoprotein n=1 Tax=Desulfitobacterium dehalogenans (strain ATCC 51507 / DSM 9161 / JW/IU-DC1) TaxID=756499 RepID=I4AAK4_DESDJ|nr:MULTISPECIES: hypothetical protein [Desulfitobacterium]AFM00989.1 hypothetical protein Desde_2673 [Desulfitobacterium dehalogenans ATCC 51507]